MLKQGYRQGYAKCKVIFRGKLKNTAIGIPCFFFFHHLLLLLLFFFFFELSDLLGTACFLGLFSMES